MLISAIENLEENTCLLCIASSVFLWEKITIENLLSELIIISILDTSGNCNELYSYISALSINYTAYFQKESKKRNCINENEEHSRRHNHILIAILTSLAKMKSQNHKH